MKKIGLLFLVLGTFYFPLIVSAALTSIPVSSVPSSGGFGITLPDGILAFGGRVATVIPCTGGVYFTIIPAKIGPTALIWTPASLTFSYGPPSHPGQSTLGLSGPPTVCFVGKVPFFGASVITIGTSAI